MAGYLNVEAVTAALQVYRKADHERDQLLHDLAQALFATQDEVRILRSDLDDERNTRRDWKKKAEDANAATQRKYSVVLIDGDGYIFHKALYQAVSNSGGSKAANELYTNVIKYLIAQGVLSSSNTDYDVLVNVYASKVGLARSLTAAGYLDHPSQLDQFFCSFVQGGRLFQFIDCGPGKERADTKLRDTFRFYADNAQCQHVFLAVTHDNGYIAELDKYRYNTNIQPKVVLVHQSPTAKSVQSYSSLPFKTVILDAVFESSPLQFASPKLKAIPEQTRSSDLAADWSPVEHLAVEPTPPQSRTSSSMSAPPGLAHNPASNVAETASKAVAAVAGKADEPLGIKNGIPINRFGQRVDLKLRPPSSTEISQFENRIKYHKLCNEHHLRDNCESYNCRFDHDPIDDIMRNTLRNKARTIPCADGSRCRVRDCFYGHVCPWAKTGCSFPNCSFKVKGLHDIKDLQVDKFVPAVRAAVY